MSQYPLAGFAVFNGATDWKYDVSPSFPDTVFNFNLIPESILKPFNDQGCVYYFNGYKNHSGPNDCDALWLKINNLTGLLNWYDLYRENYGINDTYWTDMTPEQY